MGVIIMSFVFDAQVLDWLKAEGVDVPPDYRQSRWPSTNELRTVLESLPGYVVRYWDKQGHDWDAEVVDAARGYEGMSATIWVKGIQDPNAPHPCGNERRVRSSRGYQCGVRTTRACGATRRSQPPS